MNPHLISALTKSPVGPDGDGYFGTPPSEACKANAVKFLSSLPKFYQEVIKPEDHVTPQAHGTIVIDWYYRRQFVSAEIGDELVGFFSDFDNGINPQSGGIKPDAVRPYLVTALNRLYGRTDQ